MSTAEIPLAGGHSEPRETTEEIASLTAQIKPEVERRLSKTFSRFEATQVRRQVVAGTVYHIRVLTTEAKGGDGGEGAEGCLHVRVFQPLPYTGSPPEVQAVKVAEAADSLEVL